MARRSPGDSPIEDVLVAAALRVLRSEGLTAVTVRKVAAEAGLSVGVLYNHFADAEDLLAAAMVAHMDRPDAGHGPPGDALSELEAFAVEMLEQMRVMLPLAAGLMVRPSLQARLRERSGGFGPTHGGGHVIARLRDAQRAGTVNADADVADVVEGVTALVHGLGLIEYLSGSRTTHETLLRLLSPYRLVLSVG